MFNLGIPELLVIGAAGLILFGPKRLPELAKSLGKGIRDFKKALEEGESETPPPQSTQETLPKSQTPVTPGEAEKPKATTSNDPTSKS
jgi:sec-independent protein translocase protein TatA